MRVCRQSICRAELAEPRFFLDFQSRALLTLAGQISSQGENRGRLPQRGVANDPESLSLLL
jgi:hypothetical protein